MLESLPENILVAPFDTGAARAYGPLRAAYRARNKQALDKLIASHATDDFFRVRLDGMVLLGLYEGAVR